MAMGLIAGLVSLIPFYDRPLVEDGISICTQRAQHAVILLMDEILHHLGAPNYCNF